MDGATLKRYRVEAGLTQPRLAELSGIPEIIISRLENNDPNRRFDTYAARLAGALGIPFLRAWMNETVAEAQQVGAALGESARALQGADALAEQIGAERQRWSALADEVAALETQTAEARRELVASCDALEALRPMFDEIEARVEALR